jgi:hypothetical protein
LIAGVFVYVYICGETFYHRIIVTQRKILNDRFLDGILYVFSLGAFPILTDRSLQKKDKRGQIRDLEKLSNDWRNVGNDIAVSYEKFKSECL